MFKPTLHIFGSTGALGSALIASCNTKAWPHKAYSKSGKFGTLPIDLANPKSLDTISSPKPGDWVVNLAACSQPAQVFASASTAYEINVKASEAMCRWARQKQCKYLLLSSVEVFDGENAPYTEYSPASPINEYGRQKVQAENFVSNFSGDSSLIVRTSWNISMTCVGRCLIEVTINSLRTPNARMATDNIFTIASSLETANNILSAIEADQSGLVHIASPKPISRFDLATHIANSSKSQIFTFDACLFEDLNLREPRGKENILDTSKSISSFGAKYSDPYDIVAEKINILSNRSDS
ncbi:sugar nucleotide-binding protein [Luminiphilus sp.]|nr:sugar nucleotide-binding protein [Luminiphilus sp.]